MVKTEKNKPHMILGKTAFKPPNMTAVGIDTQTCVDKNDTYTYTICNGGNRTKHTTSSFKKKFSVKKKRK